MSPAARLIAIPVRAYRLIFSPWVGHNCRYQPSCSAYALEALEAHGAWRGAGLAAWRIMRCQPWGGSGIDNVPGTDASAPIQAAPRRGVERDPATR